MIYSYLNSVSQLFLENPIAQSIGFIAMLCAWFAFLQKDDLKTIKILFISNFFWGLLFLMLSSYTAFIATIISSLRLLLSIKYKKNIKSFGFIMILIVIMGITTYSSYYSILPILSSIIGAYGFFFFSGIKLRINCLLTSTLRLFYHYHLGVIGGVINEIVIQILLLITIYNYSGIYGYRFNFMSKIKSIFHPYRDVDYGEYNIIRDKDKIFVKETIVEKIIIFIKKIIEKVKYTFRKI